MPALCPELEGLRRPGRRQATQQPGRVLVIRKVIRKVRTEWSDVAPPDDVRFPVTQAPAGDELPLQDGGWSPKALGFPGTKE